MWKIGQTDRLLPTPRINKAHFTPGEIELVMQHRLPSSNIAAHSAFDLKL